MNIYLFLHICSIELSILLANDIQISRGVILVAFNNNETFKSQY